MQNKYLNRYEQDNKTKILQKNSEINKKIFRINPIRIHTQKQ